MKEHLYLLFFVLVVSGNAQSSSDLHALFEQIEQLEDSLIDTWSGRNHPDVFRFTTADQQEALAGALHKKVIELGALPADSLSRQEEISREIMILRLKDRISRVRYKQYLMPFNAEGGFFTRPVFFLPRLPFRTKADYEAYLRWLPSFADYLIYQRELLQEGIRQGVMRPEVIVQNALRQLENWTGVDPMAHLLASPFTRMPSGIPVAEQKRLTEELKAILNRSILPAYRGLYWFLKEKYLPTCPGKPGIEQITDGRAYYEDRIRFFTTLDISPDSIFNLGLSEVARILDRMQAVLGELGYEEDMASFLRFLRSDPQFYARSPEELLSRAAWLSKKAEGALPPLFSQLYELPFTVEPVPDAIAPTYTGGRYVPGDRASDRPGIYWVNTYDLPSRPFYTLPALTLHEAVPGHHLGIMIAAELEGIPDFRRTYYINAYGEGWGLYAEFLGEEMGMYTTPYEWFGRYTYEMWRACRLVVDVGLHYKGWSRQEAIDYLASHTALSLQEIQTEVDRYIGWPAQAVSYKIGELTIKQLRRNAEEALGEAFSIQEFHQVVLGRGSLPMRILQEEVAHYIRKKQEEARPGRQ